MLALVLHFVGVSVLCTFTSCTLSCSCRHSAHRGSQRSSAHGLRALAGQRGAGAVQHVQGQAGRGPAACCRYMHVRCLAVWSFQHTEFQNYCIAPVSDLLIELKAKEKQLEELRSALALAKAANLSGEAVAMGSGAMVVVSRLDGVDAKAMQDAAASVQSKLGNGGAVVLGGSPGEGKVVLVAAFGSEVCVYVCSRGQAVCTHVVSARLLARGCRRANLLEVWPRCVAAAVAASPIWRRREGAMRASWTTPWLWPSSSLTRRLLDLENFILLVRWHRLVTTWVLRCNAADKHLLCVQQPAI